MATWLATVRNGRRSALPNGRSVPLRSATTSEPRISPSRASAVIIACWTPSAPKRTGCVGRRDDRGAVGLRAPCRAGRPPRCRSRASWSRSSSHRRRGRSAADSSSLAVDVEEGALGVHELADVRQQSADDLVDRSGAGHPLREAVQVLELAQAVAQGGVHAVREQHHHHDHAEEQRGGRRSDEERDRHQCHAGVDGDRRGPQELRAQQPGLAATEEDRDGDGQHDALAGIGGQRGERRRRARSPGRSRACGTPRTPWWRRHTPSRSRRRSPPP